MFGHLLKYIFVENCQYFFSSNILKSLSPRCIIYHTVNGYRSVQYKKIPPYPWRRGNTYEKKTRKQEKMGKKRKEDKKKGKMMLEG
jgi:hypothetical protein